MRNCTLCWFLITAKSTFFFYFVDFFAIDKNIKIKQEAYSHGLDQNNFEDMLIDRIGLTQ